MPDTWSFMTMTYLFLLSLAMTLGLIVTKWAMKGMGKSVANLWAWKIEGCESEPKLKASIHVNESHKKSSKSSYAHKYQSGLFVKWDARFATPRHVVWLNVSNIIGQRKKKK